jgi:RimJ/RimL family protein N-acetyltransferase
MQLRPLAEADLEMVRRLRNANRQFFFYDAEIDAAQQASWFRALAAKPVDFFVIEDGGAVVGTVSATRSADGIEIGNLVLDAAARGRGLMRKAVQQITTAPGHYFAEVKAGNTASRAVFEATGFTMASSGAVVRLVKDV